MSGELRTLVTSCLQCWEGPRAGLDTAVTSVRVTDIHFLNP